ncbi:MAG: methyl-accepting chemotaxis protein [SAR324 cluster bacterium]|nr:methyl-accepting chemotaxis protein [SAR324 cluster bacterium]
MKKKLSVRAQIALGFVVMVALIFALGLYNINSFMKSQKAVESIETAKFFNVLEVQHRRWIQGLSSLFLDDQITELKIQLDPTQCRMGRFIYSDESKVFKEINPKLAHLLDQLEPIHKALHYSAKEIKDLWTLGTVEKKEEARHVYNLKTTVALNQISGILGEMDEVLEAQAKGSAANLSESIKQSLVVSVTILILALLAGSIVAVTLIASIGKLLNRFVQEVVTSAEQVTSASNEISLGAQNLSQGATEQAASLEQISASMEEVSSQAKGNADGAEHTAGVIKEVNEMVAQSLESTKEVSGLASAAKFAASEGVSVMAKISTSMAEIEKSSDQITDIIEVINEITHQTKMLATNAAIEAARAGEQGKGFAVVANEVSKLAENSKASAKEISHLIRDSSAKAKQGALFVSDGEEVLAGILNNANQVSDLVGQVSDFSNHQAKKTMEVEGLADQIKTASREQAMGTEQITTALSQMDQVTQSNAANAEESASASEELSSQAEMLHNLVADMAEQFGVKLKQQQNSHSTYNHPVEKVDDVRHTPDSFPSRGGFDDF